eukprot:PhF_6_TR16981/c0_g1_i1/m.25674
MSTSSSEHESDQETPSTTDGKIFLGQGTDEERDSLASSLNLMFLKLHHIGFFDLTQSESEVIHAASENDIKFEFLEGFISRVVFPKTATRCEMRFHVFHDVEESIPHTHSSIIKSYCLYGGYDEDRYNPGAGITIKYPTLVRQSGGMVVPAEPQYQVPEVTKIQERPIRPKCVNIIDSDVFHVVRPVPPVEREFFTPLGALKCKVPCVTFVQIHSLPPEKKKTHVTQIVAFNEKQFEQAQSMAPTRPMNDSDLHLVRKVLLYVYRTIQGGLPESQLLEGISSFATTTRRAYLSDASTSDQSFDIVKELIRKIPIHEIELGQEIASGGNAAIRFCHYQGKLFAAKEIRDNSLSSLTKSQLLMGEAGIHYLARHPNIVSAIAVVVNDSDEITHLLMEYVQGKSLAVILETNPSWEQRKKWGLQISLAIAYLHESHILHRDLKSLNVLIDERDNAKVCDFGASRISDRGTLSMVATASAITTAAWCAPEAFDNKFCKASDVYSLGVILWELVTCEKPWAGHSLASVCGAVTKGTRPQLPPVHEWIKLINTCWASQAEERPTAAHVVRTLTSAGMEGLPSVKVLWNMDKCRPPRNVPVGVLFRGIQEILLQKRVLVDPVQLSVYCYRTVKKGESGDTLKEIHSLAEGVQCFTSRHEMDESLTLLQNQLMKERDVQLIVLGKEAIFVQTNTPLFQKRDLMKICRNASKTHRRIRNKENVEHKEKGP